MSNLDYSAINALIGFYTDGIWNKFSNFNQYRGNDGR